MSLLFNKNSEESTKNDPCLLFRFKLKGTNIDSLLSFLHKVELNFPEAIKNRNSLNKQEPFIVIQQKGSKNTWLKTHGIRKRSDFLSGQ